MWQGPVRTSSVLPDLYCHESLTNFDEEDCSSKDLSQSSNSNESVENDLMQSKNVLLTRGRYTNKNSLSYYSKPDSNEVDSTFIRKNDYESFESCISILDDDDYLKLLQTDEILDCDRQQKTVPSKSHVKKHNFSYSQSLINEFASSSMPNKREQHTRSESNTNIASWIKSNDTIHSKSLRNCSQALNRYDEFEQQVPEMTLMTNDQSCLDLDDKNMDVLIFKDEGMCDSDSGSELDWDSLTPPVPASPSDQRVPETELDLDLCGHIDYHNHLAPSSLTSAESFLSPSAEHPRNWYFQPRVAVVNLEDSLNSESDQVVPVL